MKTQFRKMAVRLGLTMPGRRVALALAFAVMTILAASATAAPLKIACVGDSITAGYELSSLEKYPARLQWLLGTNFVVRNYGVGGRTLLKNGDFPYWTTSEYTLSRNWGPDVVIIQLGTNDTLTNNWVYGANFMSDYEEFIVSFQTLPSQPRVILCTPPPIYGSEYPAEAGGVATNIAPAVRSLAAQFNLALIDYHIGLAGHAEWFPDALHPNTRGTAVMAALAHDAVRGIAVPPPTSLNVARGPNNRAIVTWPADAAGLVLQTASQVADTNGWTVADSIPYSDGNFLRATNTVGTTRFFRLWQPSR
ncbi:MAG: GDSL-type esterase/lipase family protein [Verrucomicrobiota bacterium]